MVVQCNKADLPTAVPTLAVARPLGFDGLAAVPAAARFGEGVLETLEIALQRWIELRSLEGALPWFPSGDQVQAWVRRMLQTDSGCAGGSFRPDRGQVAILRPTGNRPWSRESDSRTSSGKRTPRPTGTPRPAPTRSSLSSMLTARSEMSRTSLSGLARATSIAAEMPSGRIGDDLRRMLSFLREAAPASRASFILWVRARRSAACRFLRSMPTRSSIGWGPAIWRRWRRRAAPSSPKSAEDSELAALLDGEPWVALGAAARLRRGAVFSAWPSCTWTPRIRCQRQPSCRTLGSSPPSFGPPLASPRVPRTGPWPHSPRE